MNAVTPPAELPEIPWMDPVGQGFVIVLRHPDGREFMLEHFGIFWCGCENCLHHMAEVCASVTMQTGYQAAAVCLDRGGDSVTSEIDPGSRH